jgi:hypothetical protein
VTKLEYPLTLHQNLAKTPRQPLIESLPAVHAFGCLEPRNLVTGPMQRLSSPSNSSTIRCLAPAPLRRGAGACPHFGSRIFSRGCARFSQAHSMPIWPATQKGPVCSYLGPGFSPNFDKLNRQIQEVEHLVTHRKQTIAPRSNSQNFHFCPTAFLTSFQPDAASLITPRIPRA